jgi:hypothetical protein
MGRKIDFNNYNYADPALKPWMMGMLPADFRDKVSLIRSHIRYMFTRTAQMFKYTGLPVTIPAYILEQQMQGLGHCIIAERDYQFYSFTGGIGGLPDVYYRGTDYIVANPGLNFDKTYKIDEDCVFCRNDHMLNGLMPLHRRYATLLAENELSFYVAEINSRLQWLFNGSTDADKLMADNLIRDLEAGNLHAVSSPEFTGGIQLQPGAQYASQTIREIIEAEQYIKASWYNDLGLDSNYNMKRESLTMTESQMNTDALLPMIDDMFECRKEMCKKLKDMYDLDVSVEYNSAWLDNQIQMNEETAQKAAETATEGAETAADNEQDN